MKFYKLGEIPTRNGEQVFRASRVAIIIWFIVFSGAAIALLILGIFGGKLYRIQPPGIFFSWVGAAFFGLFSRLTLGQVRASLKPTNWLLRCNSSGIIIKYRSFLNWSFPAEDAQAVGIEYSEIAWARKVKERRVVPGMDHNRQLEFLTCLDFCLANPDTTELEARLQAEQRAEPPGRLVKTTVLDYPVEVLPGGIIRLRWKKSGASGISPSAAKAIQYLGRHVKINAAESSSSDLSYRAKLTPEEADEKILKLARSGDKLGAIKLTQQVYRSSLTDAVKFVEELKSRG